MISLKFTICFFILRIMTKVKKTLTINIFTEIGTTIAVTQQSAQIVFNKIDKILSLGLKVKIDFTNIELITPAFLNAAIGQLYSKYSGNELQEKIELQNLLTEDIGLFQKVINNAKVYFKDSE